MYDPQTPEAVRNALDYARREKLYVEIFYEHGTDKGYVVDDGRGLILQRSRLPFIVNPAIVDFQIIGIRAGSCWMYLSQSL